MEGKGKGTLGRQGLFLVGLAALAALCIPVAGRAAQQQAPAESSARPAVGDHPAETAAAPPVGKKFDMEAARIAVRGMHFSGSAADAQAGSVVLSADRPEVARFREKAEMAKRPECLTAFQGMGVLALVAMPLAILIDKKDSGCKFGAVR